ncbi:MAG: hypothetical protein ACYC2P_08760 [Paludibacteraceae bacterium]
MKTHWKAATNPDYIGAYSLEPGQDLIVTIENVTRELVTSTGGKKEECTVAKLKGQKPFIINRTNAKTISQLYGTPYIEDWAGISIKLYVTTTKFAGEEVECLRIRKEIPKLPDLIEGTQEFEKVKKALKNGYTVSEIEKKYKISNELKTKLNEGI